MALRVPQDTLKQIEASPSKQDVPESRNHGIIEALLEKLGHASGRGGSNGTR